jgi:hypothetical protein
MEAVGRMGTGYHLVGDYGSERALPRAGQSRDGDRGRASADPFCPASPSDLAEVPLSSGGRISAWERWTWARCREGILGLKDRLGYGQQLWALGFQLLDDGRLLDPFHGVEIFDPARAGPAHLVPSSHSAVPEIYCLLRTYADAAEWPLTGRPLPLTALDPVQRPQLSAADCAALLHYAEQDWTTLQASNVPFVGERLARGDLAFQVWPLPRVPIALTLWQGDEEVPDGGMLAFDHSAAYYLPGLLLELAWLTVWRLRNILDPEDRWGYHRPVP